MPLMNYEELAQNDDESDFGNNYDDDESDFGNNDDDLLLDCINRGIITEELRERFHLYPVVANMIVVSQEFFDNYDPEEDEGDIEDFIDEAVNMHIPFRFL